MPRAGLTTDLVVAAAADLADEVGFEQLSVSALARRCGVRDASLYAHVRNLQDLRTRVALLAGGELIDRIAVAVAGRSGKYALTAFADAYRAFALERPGRYAATQARIDQALIADSRALRRTAEITYGMLRGYGLAEPDLTDAVRLLRATFHGYCALEATGGFGDPREVDRSWEKAVAALHLALENWPREQTPAG
ncbi:MULTISPECIES: TetR-like C-terminal domain-containing protein [Streptomyces]|uniref:TetR-like C-terminal domain-containing protein n=1 Tax=Streptomyces doudnae TaxID=3075536 RepID=A0ABD5EZT4_9ACTN|nr:MULTISPECIES: TetR-like C-terminal domain-containing protein [unclassified Streptomyces]MDT0440198.1 TetR-like C-terminal domain-containing protein [Streptomyces sp. DSM 41981]MYQ64101.1 TetR family transcriptional regulator [Streptomyces sp. SID4950]SCD71747.1 transcriptional regulator, TetR family [Streptomyces sp. SolWspMP-5a-2]